MQSKDNRCRNWTFVAYPEESLNPKYREILKEQHLCWIESPVHDDDSHGDGTKKKKHIHFILVFEGNKSFDQITEIQKTIFMSENCPPAKPVKNMVGMCRYLIHLDDPDKAQYSKDQIFIYGGIDIESYFMPTKRQLADELALLFQYIDGSGIKSYRELCLKLQETGQMNWFYIATSTNTFAVTSFFKKRDSDN